MDVKKTAKKIWWFIWEDDSPASWIVNVALAFVIIKFLVYPFLSLVLATSHPVVAVVSGSMEHGGQNLDAWWTESCCKMNDCQKRESIYAGWNTSKADFEKFGSRNGFNKGDLMVLKGSKTYQKGEILVYTADGVGEPIIHRIISKNADGTVTTLGDNNCGGVIEFERKIDPPRYIGKAILRIPYLGWIKIGFVELLYKIRVEYSKWRGGPQ